MAREYKTRISQAIEAFATERQDRGFCAADVSVYLGENGIDANTTSIYRMEKADHSCHEHLHMQCVKCGRVIHIDRDTMNHIAKGVQERYGFMIDCDRSSICGICKDCQRRCGVAVV